MSEKNFIIAGFGGQGVLLAGEVLANAFMLAGKNVTWYPSYGAEMRGGTVNCEIVMSDDEVSEVNKSDADFIVALNQASFDRFLSKILDCSLETKEEMCWCYQVITSPNYKRVLKEIKTRTDINYLFAPITKLAEDLGNVKMANILSLGILAKADNVVSLETLNHALDAVIPPHRKNLLPLNIKALKIGYEYDYYPHKLKSTKKSI